LFNAAVRRGKPDRVCRREEGTGFLVDFSEPAMVRHYTLVKMAGDGTFEAVKARRAGE
jgi:hypothetical protein